MRAPPRESAAGLKATAKLSQLIGQLVLSRGGTLLEESASALIGTRTCWSMQTKLGAFTTTVYTSRDGYLTVFGKFAEPERARDLVDCNPYTGKWNLHPGKHTETTPEVVAETWRSRLEYIERRGT